MKIKNNIFYLCIYAFSYAFAENSTEVGALCIDESLCISHNPSLSRFVESIPQCPKFILRQQILRDQKSSLTTDSPDEICSTGTTNNLNHFENAHKLESYLQNNPHFSNLNTPPHFSSCLSQGVLVPLDLGKTSFHIQEKFLPEHKKKLAVAEYYSSLRRLSDGVERSLQNITAIDLMIGQNALLKDVSCNNFELLSQDVTNQCKAVKQCPANNSSPLQESAKDTLLALQAVETIEKERLRLVAERGKLGGSINQNRYQRRANPNKQKIEELTGQIRDLEERQQNIQSFYPWILGKKFKKDYNAKDYTNYAQSSEESKKEMEIQIAGLIQNQLTHTRAKLKERTEDFLKASACIKGEESLCEDLDVEKVLAKAPPIDHNEIFERDRKKELKSKMEEGVLSPEERQEYRRLVTREGTADGLFQVVSCLQTQRKAVRDVHKELALGALDIGIVVGTMGLGTPIVAGRIALRLGSALSKAQKLSKAKRIQNLGIFGTDVSLSTPYMKEAMNICEDELNQLEETVAGSEEGSDHKVCEKVPVRAKHTSDLKSCILQASLASLPITLPILGLSGMALAKGVRSSSIPPKSSAEKAEEVLGLRLSPEQRRAVETAHLVGKGERGKDGALAGIGNYTEAQLRRKAEILRQAGFSKNQRRTLMKAGVVGDDLLRRASRKLEQDLQAIRNSPQERLLREQGFKRSYYAGVDQAREFNAVAKYLRKIKADPKRTHIQYFSDQIEKTIADFEQAFRKHNQDNPEFLAERLKILEELKKEARKRMKDQDVTYDWWANFNLRLPMIAEDSDFIRQILEMRSRKKLIDDLDLNNPTIREKVDTEIAYNRELAREIKKTINAQKRKGYHILVAHQEKSFKQLNPEKIISNEGAYTSERLEEIYSSVSDASLWFVRDGRPHKFDEIGEELGWFNIDSLKNHEEMEDLLQTVAVRFRRAIQELSIDRSVSLPPGMRGIEHELDGIDIFVRKKENFPKEIMFFTTDELGIMAFNKLKNDSHFVGVSGGPLTANNEKMQAFQFSAHDLQHIEATPQMETGILQTVLERIDNISRKADREKTELALFIYHHEGGMLIYDSMRKHYNLGAETNLSKSERKQLEADTKKSVRKMMKAVRDRFFNSDDLQGLLPESVNVNNREEIKKFLKESADIFADILLTR